MLSSVAPPRTPALLAALPASVSLYSPARWQHPASQLCSRQAGGGAALSHHPGSMTGHGITKSGVHGGAHHLITPPPSRRGWGLLLPQSWTQ